MSRLFGWALLLIAALGFLASRGSLDARPDTAPHALGLFPVNLVDNLLHLAGGAWGVFAARGIDAALVFTRTLGMAFLLLLPLGIITPSLFGLVPIGGNDLWLNALLGVPLAYVGYTSRNGRAAASDPETAAQATASSARSG